MLQFKWMNESSIEKTGDCWKIAALPKSDFFCNNETVGKEGITPASLSNAPFYYTEVSGDFVMRVKVSLDFKSACSCWYFPSIRVKLASLILPEMLSS